MDSDFEDVFRKWAERPVATSGADAARTIVAVISGENRGSRKPAAGRSFRLTPAMTTLGAAALILIAAAASFVRSLPPAGFDEARVAAPGVSSPGSRGPVPAREADVVLWLDDGTPVYVFLPDSAK